MANYPEPLDKPSIDELEAATNYIKSRWPWWRKIFYPRLTKAEIEELTLILCFGNIYAYPEDNGDGTFTYTIPGISLQQAVIDTEIELND